MIVETTRPRVVRAARLGWVFLDCGDDDCGDDDCGDDTPSCRSSRQARLTIRWGRGRLARGFMALIQFRKS